MRRAGLAIAVGDAVPEAKAIAHYTTKALARHGRGPRNRRNSFSKAKPRG